jgi:ferredoxin/flavodoxin---NADP+ reductase
MYELICKRVLADNITLLQISAPRIARKAKPGNFIILRVHEKGERIPLTICDSDPETGLITLIFMETGKTTMDLAALELGDRILDVMGPLGNELEIENYGTVVVIGGGIGTAVAYPEAKALSKAGNNVISIVGARNKDLLILEDEMDEISSKLYITTDDGSKGHNGFVTDVLRKLIDDGTEIDLITAIGPPIMMKVICYLTRPHGLKTIVNLNPLMLDGTGMCGGCRVSVGGTTLFACVDGPSFDGHQVDFHELMSRLQTYRPEESTSLEHACRLAGVK